MKQKRQLKLVLMDQKDEYVKNYKKLSTQEFIKIESSDYCFQNQLKIHNSIAFY